MPTFDDVKQQVKEELGIPFDIRFEDVVGENEKMGLRHRLLSKFRPFFLFLQSLRFSTTR
jgi:hypothetical protein